MPWWHRALTSGGAPETSAHSFLDGGRSPGLRPPSFLWFTTGRQCDSMPEEDAMGSKASRTYPEPGTFLGADGETYSVRPLSINGLIKIEEHYGFESIEEAFETKKLELHKPKKLRWMLCTILQEAHPDMTEEKAGEIITVGNLAEAQAAVIWSFTAGLPLEEPEEEAEDPRDPPGRNSEAPEGT